MNSHIFVIMCLLVIAFLILLIIMVKNKKKVILLVPVIVGIAISTAIILNFTVLYYGEDELSIATSSEDDFETFSLNIDCKKLSYEHTYGRFATKLALIELKKEIEKEYGDKIVISSDDTQIVVTIDNHVVTLKLEDSEDFLIYNKYIYCVSAECISLEKDEDYFVDIPFPKEYLDVKGAYENEMSITCDFKTLSEFYKNFTNVTIGDDEIVINQGSPVYIKVNDGKVFIEIE